ncbi:sensor histidine kinase [Dactylosporangium aurantiacum]|uniref:histidine kinase n=1 Tax=Dactylosporangium aurantiacum TaxID=35754 RepID=A0A9Q9IS18_9ACTN|nr:histidine kinase [Dactylosporangium aurantiacum]UWZ58339.1 sensor histidine kinase [Dactylosporangium aurantiacum]
MAHLPAWLFGLTAAAELAAVLLSWGLEPPFDTVMYAVYALVTAGAGALVAARHPGNPIGWLFCGFALLNALASDLAQGWGMRATAEGWPGAAVGEGITAASWLPSGYGWMLTFLLFPDGRLPGPRWRAVPWVGAAGLLLAGPGWVMSPDRGRDFASGRNPVAVEAVPTGALVAVGMTLFIGALVASAGSLVVRYRRSAGERRQQLKWFAVAAAAAGLVLPLSFVFWYVTPAAAQIAAAVSLTLLPLVACLAILRYRLYDIDVIVDRTVVYATVTAVLAAGYALTTLTLGTTLGRGSGWVTAAATLVVAVAFRPLRDRVQDMVNRRFHRARYQAARRMTDFLEALRAGRAAPEQVQGVLRELTGDPRLRLLLFLPESQVYVDLDGVPATDAGGGPGGRIDVERAGRPVGRVEPAATAADPMLLRSLIESGGLAIEIARLDVELRRQLAEVHASRTRIVNAVTEERRRLERDLHDGAQQRLVTIGLALRHAQHQLAAAAVDQASVTLDEAVVQVRMTIDELRELARGLPPAQLDAGLAPAFLDLARRAPVPVEVSAPPERYDRGIEGAAYFIGCEGLTNAVKHARATSISLRAHRDDGRLIVTVADDGIGGAVPVHGSGLSGLADRVTALGGVLRIDSRPGAGTTLTAELPCGS